MYKLEHILTKIVNKIDKSKTFIRFRHVSEGFKITVDHHLDQPLMSMTEMDITPGFETQVAVTPVLYTTTNAARTRFTPEAVSYTHLTLPTKRIV